MLLRFLNPWWLLALLALVPLLAHLFSRTRPRPRPFPSLLLLREALREVRRVQRPRDRWLLLLRTVAFLGLVAALLQPFLYSRFGGSGSRKTVIFVVDLTASMSFVDGTRTRLAAATATAEDILATLPTDSRANIVWAQAHPAPALPEPTADFNILRQALRSASVRPETGSPAEALALAARQLAEGDGERELIVLSDFQRTSWLSVPWALPAGVKLTRVALGEGTGANLAIAGLATEPQRPIAGQEVRLQCRVRNFSPEPQRPTVYLQAGESRFSPSVEIPPWGETLAAVTMKFPAAGSTPLKASLTSDNFPADDTRFGLAEVRGAIEVVVLAAVGDTTGDIWLRASQALDGTSVHRVDPGAPLTSQRPGVVLAAHWGGENRDLLLAWQKAGTALIVQPAGVGGMAALLEESAPPAPGTPGATTEEWQQHPAPGWRIRVAQEDHPLFALFARGTYGDPADGHFTRRVASPWSAAATSLIVFEDGVPALALHEPKDERVGGGAVALWNLDLEGSDWPAKPAFLPVFGELLRHLASRSGGELQTPRLSGEPLTFEAGAALEAKDVQLLDEDDRPIPLQHQGATARTVEPLPPGAYRWMAQGSLLGRAAINLPDEESDLRRLSPAEFSGEAAGAFITSRERTNLAALREGRPLWPWCLGLAALCLLLEGTLLTRFRARSSVESQPAGAI